MTKRLLVYSHDTFGLGNVRRMLALCEHLLSARDDVSILLITGSPMIHGFRLPARLDYIKLPVVERTEAERYAVKYLGADLAGTMKLRSDLILTTVANFRPDVVLVDKKPLGVKSELRDALGYLATYAPRTRIALVLRDILDHPRATVETWRRDHYHEALAAYYDDILVLGSPAVFDLCTEYRLPATIARMVRFCGYTRRQADDRPRDRIRQQLGLTPTDRLVLVTPGGGQDGCRLLRASIEALTPLLTDTSLHALLVTGPELSATERQSLSDAAAGLPRLRLEEFIPDLLSYMAAADVVVAMGGYNTICEIVSLNKRAIVVPRSRPVREQLIRAERMAALGLFEMLHPDQLTPDRLRHCLVGQLTTAPLGPATSIDLNALPRITSLIGGWLDQAAADVRTDRLVSARGQRRLYDDPTSLVRALTPTRQAH